MKIIKPKLAFLLFLQIYLTSVFAWDASPDTVLEGRINTKYSQFLSSQRDLIQRNRDICPAVHFVNDLGTQLLKADITDLPRTNELRRIISAILLYGTGVGGISTRQANEDEKQKMVNAIFLVTASGTNATFTAATPHQQAVQGFVIQSTELLEICRSTPSPYRQLVKPHEFRWLSFQGNINPFLIQALKKTEEEDEDKDFVNAYILKKKSKRSVTSGRDGTSAEEEVSSTLRRAPLERGDERLAGKDKQEEEDSSMLRRNVREEPFSKEQMVRWEW